jgi:GT2 family glycosyltransferase/glycosyltransferase involved in cell wall biosynthesis
MRVLLIVHGLPPASCGGTETYTFDLAHALARQPSTEVAILAREADPHRPELHVRFERRGLLDVYLVNNTFQTCTSFEDTYRNPALCDAVRGVIDRAAPDVAHVQHLTCISTDLVGELRSRHVPIVMTLNDYWAICHRGQLIDLDGRQCAGPGPDGCARCIPAGAVAPRGVWRTARRMRDLPLPVVRSAPALVERLVQARGDPRVRDLSARRARHMRAVCDAGDRLLAPSRTLRDEYVRFGIEPDRLRLIDQGIVTRPVRPSRPGSRVGPLRAAFAGSLILSKGPHVLLDALDRLPPGAVTVDFLGSVAPYHGDVRHATRFRRRLGHPAIRRSGPVPHERVGEALEDVDVLVVPSIWIENAPFVIREAFDAGIPVVASRLGGMADMVRDGVDGLLFEPGNPDALASAFARLTNEPDLLPRLRAGIRRMMTIDEDAAQLCELYRDLRGHPRVQAAVAMAPSTSTRIDAVILNYRTSDDTCLAAQSIRTSHREGVHVIVVDNGSGDGSEHALRQRLPWAEHLQTGANLGFSGGCNAGIRGALSSGAEGVLLVNSDGALHPDALGHLERALGVDPSLGIVGPVVLSREEPDLIASAGMRYGRNSGRMRHVAAGRRIAALGAPPVQRVDGVSGCAMLVRRSVFERIGLLDEAYYFSFEDLDFCLRASAAGFETAVVSAAIAYHQGGRTVGARSARRVYYGVRNHLRLAGLAAPQPALVRTARASAVFAYNAAYVALSPDVPTIRGAGALVRGGFDHLRGRYGP